MTVEEFRSPQKNKRRSRASRRTTTPRDTNPKVDGDGGDEPRVSTLPRTGNATDSPETPRQLKRAHRETGPAENAGGAVPSTPESRRPSAKQQEQTDRSRRSNAAKKSSSRNAGKGYESAWDKYVKDFIAKYQLNDEQTQKANTVLEDCKAQALRYLSSRKGQFEQIDKQLETLKKSKDKNKSKSTSELTKKRGELMTPIDHIFEKQLKPRLEKLPTRAQRRAAEAAAKKKPSTARKAGGKKAPPKPKGADD